MATPWDQEAAVPWAMRRRLSPQALLNSLNQASSRGTVRRVQISIEDQSSDSSPQWSDDAAAERARGCDALWSNSVQAGSPLCPAVSPPGHGPRIAVAP